MADDLPAVITQPAEASSSPTPIAVAAVEALRAVLAKAPEVGTPIHKVYRPVEIKAVDGSTFEVDATISTRSIDRDREVVLPEGMKIKGPRRIPLMASHDYRELRKQIGEVVKVRPDGDSLHARIRYLAGKGNPEADWGWVLVEEDLAAYSIGFIPTKWDNADINDDKVVQAILAGKKPLRTYTEWELVEVSHVGVPSNRDAVQHAVTKGLYSTQEGENLLTLMEQTDAKTEKKNEEKVEPHEEPDEEKTEASDDVLSLLELKQDNWRVGGARSLPLSDDSSWDASAARRSLGDDMGAWKKAHIVYNASVPDQKGSYKLPFARREGGALRASKSGLQAARQRLSATDIPESVRAAAGRFIDSYLGPQEERMASLRFVKDAPEALERIEIRTADDEVIFVGVVQDLCDRVLHSVEPQQVEVSVAPIALESTGLKSVLDNFIAQFKAALDEHAKRLPTFPADSAAFTAIGDLTEAVIAVAEKIARREATIAVEKAQGNVDHYRR